MPAFLTRLWNRLSARRAPLSVMIIGLDDGGKTSILGVLTESSAARKSPTTNKEQSTTAAATATNTQAAKPGSNHEEDNNDVLQEVDLTRLSEKPQHHGGIHLTSSHDRGTNNKKVSPTIGYNYERIRYGGQVLNVLDFSGQSKYRGLWQEFFNCVDGIVFVIDSSDLIRFVVVRDELETLLGHPYFATIAPNVSRFILPQDHVSSMTTENGRDQSRMVIGGASSSSAGELPEITLAPQQYAQKQVVISQGRLIQSPLSDWADLQSPAQSSGGSSSTFNRRSSSFKASSAQSSSNGRHHQQTSRRLRTKIPILFLANKSDLNNSADTETITEALNLNQVSKKRHPWIIQATSVTTNQGIFEGFDWLLSEILTTN